MEQEPDEPETRTLLEYRRPEPDFELRPTTAIAVPYATGFCLGACAGFLTLQLLLTRRRSRPDLGELLATAGLWAFGTFVIEIPVTTLFAAIRRGLSKVTLQALPDAACFWTGLGIGVGQFLLPYGILWWTNDWVLLLLFVPAWFFAGSLAAAIALVRPVP